MQYKSSGFEDILKFWCSVVTFCLNKDRRIYNDDNNDTHILSLSSLFINHLLLSCSIITSGKTFFTNAFPDCGATDNFCDPDYAQQRNLPFFTLPTPRQLYLVNDTPAAQITHTVSLQLKIHGHCEFIIFYLTNLGKYELICYRSLPWWIDPELSGYEVQALLLVWDLA